MTEETHPHVLLVGNPVDGITVIGPFVDAETAIRHAEAEHHEWWVTALHPPDATGAEMGSPSRRSRYRIGTSITGDYLVEEHFPDRVNLLADYTSPEQAQEHLDRLREVEH